eukprot:Tamp_38685.p2 GENE.Tamp_38685~~Tamp_38685.p2  ORF type:complete len:133 (-),score=32.92 Tamp_38685:17-415(-)
MGKDPWGEDVPVYKAAAAAAAAAKLRAAAAQPKGKKEKTPAEQAAEAAKRRDKAAAAKERMRRRSEALAMFKDSVTRIRKTTIAFAPVLAPAAAFVVGRGLNTLVKSGQKKPEPVKAHPLAFLGYKEHAKKK